MLNLAIVRSSWSHLHMILLQDLPLKSRVDLHLALGSYAIVREKSSTSHNHVIGFSSDEAGNTPVSRGSGHALAKTQS